MLELVSFYIRNDMAWLYMPCDIDLLVLPPVTCAVIVRVGLAHSIPYYGGGCLIFIM
jgi:hypothetical protein